jgi:hypothetical protein
MNGNAMSHCPGFGSRLIGSLNSTRLASSFLLLVVFWGSTLSFPDFVYGFNLDQSWEQDLAYLYRHNAQAGKDYIFAYGPLGVFYSQYYDPELYWQKYGWEILLKLALASLAVAAVARMPDRTSRISYCLLFFIFLAPNRGDTLFPHLMLAGALLLCLQPRFWVPFSLFLLLLAVLSLVKFSFFVLSLLYVLTLIVYFLSCRRWRAAIFTPILFALFLLATWAGVGQSVANVPAYLRGSLQLTDGYTAAMARDGNPWELVLALVAAAFGCAALMTLDLRSIPRSRLVAVVFLIGLGLFQQWKSGFVRHDKHSHGFFVYAMLLPFLLPLAGKTLERRAFGRRLLLYTTVLLGVVGFQVSNQIPVAEVPFLLGSVSRFSGNLVHAATPRSLQKTLEEARASFPKKASQLPRVQKQVGTAAVDVLTEHQGVLFVNELNYRPRPVLQSSCAYTSYLLRANAEFLRSQNAPEFLLLYWYSIDGRLPTMEDSQALQVILASYAPVLVEAMSAVPDAPFLLLKRRATAPEKATGPGDVLLERTVRFDERIDIEKSAATYQTLALQIRYSLWGKVRSFFYKPPPVFIHLKTTSSESVTYRLIPAMTEDSFLINPFVGNPVDLLKLFGLPGAARVESFRITSAETGPKSYEPEIGIVLRTRPDLVPAKLPEEEIKKLLGGS